MDQLKNIYLNLFNYIIQNHSDKLRRRQVHTLLMSVWITGILMWAYAILAYFTISSKIPFYVGVTASLIHLMTPLLLRFIPNIFLVTSVMLTAGVGHQSTFAYFSGGFESEILIWFGIIPLLGGIIAGKNAALLWGGVVIAVSSVFLYGHYINYEYPYSISDAGLFYSHLLLVVGWILVTTMVIHTFKLILERHEYALEEETRKLDSLLRILMHDMSNSIHIMKGTISLLNKNYEEKTDIEKRNLATVEKHNTFLAETLKSIKSMYVLKKNLKDIELNPINICDSVNYILNILEQKILEKKIQVVWDHSQEKIDVMGIPHILENQIIQNILTNAIKFSKENGKITISLKKEQNKERNIQLIIQDEGIGMPKKLLDNIFNPAVRTSRPGTKNEAGTGLGMHIVKNFVEEMKATINIESEEGHGTKIMICFNSALSI